jgi:hypothetical protein
MALVLNSRCANLSDDRRAERQEQGVPAGHWDQDITAKYARLGISVEIITDGLMFATPVYR